MFGCFNLHDRPPHCHIDARGQSPAGDERAQGSKIGRKYHRISDIEPANCAKAMRARDAQSVDCVKAEVMKYCAAPKAEIHNADFHLPTAEHIAHDKRQSNHEYADEKIPTEMVDKITG